MASRTGLHFEARRLRYDSAERGLLREVLTRAIVRGRGVQAIHRRSADLLAPADPSALEWSDLGRLIGTLAGSVPDQPELRWHEGLSTRLDWADDRLWLLIDPCTVFDGIDDANKAFAADVARERTVRRYNRQLNALLGFWTSHLADKTDLRAPGIGDAIDAVFRLLRYTAFSRRT